MANVLPIMPSDYWQKFIPEKNDTEFIGTYLFEHEIPLPEKELVPVLVHERIRMERESLLKEKLGDGKTYLPKDDYRLGEQLVFPMLNWEKGKVISSRSGLNPGGEGFKVIEVQFEKGTRCFACLLPEHKLNQPSEVIADDPQLDPEYVIRNYGQAIEQKLLQKLNEDPDLVRIAGRWFPRALLLDVNMGHLNLAEAALEEAGGKPLAASALIAQVDLPAETNSKLVEFSMNYALQEDGRFDEVGPAGEVLWCLKRLEPEDVQKIPGPLHYIKIDYDQSLISNQMKKLILDIDDELSDVDEPAVTGDEVIISITYPHWRSGTLPVSRQVRGLFPTAYESPRVRFTLVDEQSGQEIPAWVVLQHRYVAGLAAFYKKYELFPGCLIAVKRGKKSGQVIISAKTRRPTRDWIRTVLVGSDGGIVFAMLKQNLVSEYNERMVIAVPDVAGVDDATMQLAKAHVSFEQTVETTMKEMVKLNVQGHVHAQELYSAVNVMYRCPPAPILAHLVESSRYKHIGDLHFRLAETEVEND